MTCLPEDFLRASQTISTCPKPALAQPAGVAVGRRASDLLWQWVPDQAYHRMTGTSRGHLHRTARHQARTILPQYQLEDLGDEAPTEPADPSVLRSVAQQPHTSVITVDLSVVYSPVFQTPVLYFFAYEHGTGSPLPLNALADSSFFRKTTRPTLGVDTNSSTAALAESPSTGTGPSGSAPVISQGDHPITSSPSFFLHPCETQTVLEEVLQATDGLEREQEDQAVAYLRTWLMLVHSLVDLEGF